MDKTILRCETCKRRIETLSEEEALNDLQGHGWTKWETATHLKCYDCATDYDDYTTYYAGRVKRGYPNRVYMKYVECYTEKTEVDSRPDYGLDYPVGQGL